MLVIVNNVAMNTGVHMSSCISVFAFFLDIYPGVGLPSHKVVPFLVS